MSAVREDGCEELPCTALAIKEGYQYKILSGSSYRMGLADTVADVVTGIAVESSLDAVGAAKTLVAGETALFYVPGCGKKVKVASLASKTYHRGAKVYGGQTADVDGLASTDNSNSAQCIGHYFGAENLTTAANGELIDVLLDVPIGGS